MGLLQLAASGPLRVLGAATEVWCPTGRDAKARELSHAPLDPPPPTHSIVTSLSMINLQDVTLQPQEATDFSQDHGRHCAMIDSQDENLLPQSSLRC